MREPDEPIEREPEERPAIEELVGESEYSVEGAHIDERSPSRRVASGPGTRGDEEPDPDDLGRYALELATEAPVDRSDEGMIPMRGPID